MSDELRLAADARAERRRMAISIPDAFFNPVHRGISQLSIQQDRKLDRLAAAQLLERKIEGEMNLRDAAIRVKTQEAQEERKQAEARARLISEAMAGRVPIADAMASGDMEVMEAAARYEDVSTIQSLDLEGLKKYAPLTEPGRQLWQNRVAAAESEAKAAEKERKESEEAEAQEVAFSKIKQGLKGKKFTTLSEAVDFLGSKEIDVPSKLFPRVKEYVVSERLGEDLELRKSNAERLADRTAKSVEIAEKRLDLAERQFKRAVSEDDKRAAEQEIDNARQDLGLELRALEDLHGKESLYMGEEGKGRVRAVLDRVGKRAEAPKGPKFAKPEDDPEVQRLKKAGDRQGLIEYLRKAGYSK